MESRMRMRRAIVVSGVLGVVTTIGVSWVLAVWPPSLTATTNHLFAYGCGVWSVSRSSGVGVTSETWRALAVLFPETSEAGREQAVEWCRGRGFASWDQEPPPIRGVMARAARRPLTSETSARVQWLSGWPWRAMCYSWRPKNEVRAQEVEQALPIELVDSATGQASKVYLPVWPLWWGFVGDVMVFGAVWWMVLVGPGALRAWKRKRRGLCPACGYDVRGAVGCAECGWGRESEKRKTKSEN